MSQEDFIDKTIKDNPIPADEAWRLYKGLKVSGSLPLEWNARTTDLARYFYIEGHSSGIAYGRQTPDREMLHNLLIKFYYFTETGNARGSTVSNMAEMFLRSEANK